MKKNSCLLLVDLQNDFMPGGSLAVPAGDETVPVAQRLMERFDAVFASLDYHPPDHLSFASNHPGRKAGETVELKGKPQIIWPDHCVRGTWGSEFHPALDRKAVTRFIRKGLDCEIDSFSAFFDNHGAHETPLRQELKRGGFKELFVMGLATDYCVKFTVLDAVRLGYDVKLVLDGCRSVNLSPKDGDQAVETMRQGGATIIAESDVPNRLFRTRFPVGL